MATITLTAAGGFGTFTYSTTVADADVSRISAAWKAKNGINLTATQVIQSMLDDLLKRAVALTQATEVQAAIPAPTALPYTPPA